MIVFKNRRFSPEDFSAVWLADAEIDATDAVEQALGALKAEGNGVLDLTRGIYRISRPIVLPGIDGLAIEGNGPATGFSTVPPFPSKKFAISSGSVHARPIGVLGQTTLSAPVARGDHSLRVVDPGLFKVGDALCLRCATTSSSGSVIWGYQHNEVVAIELRALRLALSVPFFGSVGGIVEKIDHRRGLRISGIAVRGADAMVEHSGLVLIYERGARIEDVRADGQAVTKGSDELGGGITWSSGYDNEMVDCSASRCGSSGDNGIAVAIQSAFRARSIRTSAGTFGMGITLVTDSQFDQYASDRDWGRCIKLHASHANQFSNLRLSNGRHTGLGFAAGSSDNQFSNVSISGVGVQGMGNQNIGVWTNGESNDRNSILGLDVVNCPGAAAGIAPGDYDNVLRFNRKPFDQVSFPIEGRTVVTYG